MNNQEYEQKKRECWEEYWRTHKTYLHGDSAEIVLHETFTDAFDRAYALGKQEKDADAMLSGWVARDENNSLYLYEKRPVRDHNEWVEETVIYLDDDLFPDLTWDSDPEEVEIIIKRKNNE